MRVIKQNEKNERPRFMVFFDTESRVRVEISDDDIEKVLKGENVVRQHEHYLTVACYVDRKKKGERWEVYKDDNLNNFWFDVDKFIKTGQKAWVFAHNAKYDVIVTNAIKYLSDLGYILTSFSDSNPFFMKWIKKVGKKTKSIWIVSTTNYFSVSIEKLGKTFGLEKLSIDYESEDIDKVITYCKRDVEIMKLAMEKYIEMLDRDDLGNFALTVAGQAFNAFRHRFMHDEILIHRYEEIIKLEREVYAGGRNEAFRIGKIDEEVYYYDVNSMYPYVMKEYVYPVKFVGATKRMKLDELKEYLEKRYLAVAKVRVETDVPIFMKKMNNKLVFPVGRFETVLCTPELIEGIKRGLIKKILHVALYEGKPIFREYVDFFYNKRVEAKKKGDEVMTFFYKIFLNSLYGKFGQKAIKWERIGDADIEIVHSEDIKDNVTGERYRVRIFGGSIFRTVHKEGVEGEAYNSFPAVAAHVTAYARMVLWRYMEIAGIENVYYCDTDSLFVNEEGHRRLLEAGCLDDYELGKLKLEEKGRIEIRGCKDYTFNTKEKIKGVNKGAVRIEENKYLVVQWNGISYFIKKGETGIYENKLIIKTLKRKYDKGEVQEDGKVYPFRLQEW